MKLFSPEQTFFSRQTVSKDADFRRIDGLPWRDPALPSDDYCKDLSGYLRRPGGQFKLWPVQTMALQEAHDHRRLFAPIPVGHGKGPLSILIPVITEAKRPVLFVPASLREQTENHLIPLVRKHFRTHPLLTILSYEQLSSVNYADVLEQIQPDQIIFDEVHKIKDPKAGRTKRILRYFARYPNTECYAMSGSILNRSLRDYWHIFQMTHKEDAALPLAWHTMNDWCEALDARVKSRRRPGPILEWADEPGGDDTIRARKAYRRRLVHVPGVVAGDAESVGNGLEIFEHEVEVPAPVEDALVDLREQWCTPGGEEFSDRLDLCRHAAELSNGFYYRWNPPPPVEWRTARSEFHKMIREVLTSNKRELDTMLQVVQAIDNGAYPHNAGVLKAWRIIEPVYDPEENREAVWVSDFLIREAEAWAKEHQGIVWVAHRAVGDRFTEIPYFGAADERILTHRGPCAASLWAHGTGKNLQHFSDNLVLCSPSNGATWEQLLGRTHRPGQEADTVHVWVCFHALELWEAFMKADADARFVQQTGGHTQKILLATRDIPDPIEAEQRSKTQKAWRVV